MLSTRLVPKSAPHSPYGCLFAELVLMLTSTLVGGIQSLLSKKKKKRWKTYQQTFRFWTPSTLSLKSPCVCTRRMPYSLNENNYKSEKGAHDTNLRLCLNDKCLFSHRYLPFAVVQTRLDKTPFDDDLTILFTPHDSKSRGKVFLGLARCQWLKQFICTKSE